MEIKSFIETGGRIIQVMVTEVEEIYDMSDNDTITPETPVITEKVYDMVMCHIREKMPEYVEYLNNSGEDFNHDYFEEHYLELETLLLNDYSEIKEFNELKDYNIEIREVIQR